MSEKVDLTVVIVTFNEGVNLRHALENVREFARNVVVLDSHYALIYIVFIFTF